MAAVLALAGCGTESGPTPTGSAAASIEQTPSVEVTATPTTTASATASPTASAGCTLKPTIGLAHLNVQGSAPGGTALRSYELFVPAQIVSASRVPLLVSLHGLTSNGKGQDVFTHWSDFDTAEASAGRPFILLLPDGLKTLWSWGTEDSYDVRYVFELIRSLEASGCVDPDRVYIDGWSEGAFMAERLACAAGDPAIEAASDPVGDSTSGIRLAGVAVYAGGNPAASGSCGPGGSPVQAIPILQGHGLDDRLVGPSMGYAAFTAWASRYGCAQPSGSGSGAGSGSEAVSKAASLRGCRDGVTVRWWPIPGAGHVTWSCAADPTWHNRIVWAFLTQGAAPPSGPCS
jgi:polyhydroxybutyrate depolymerase